VCLLVALFDSFLCSRKSQQKDKNSHTSKGLLAGNKEELKMAEKRKFHEDEKLAMKTKRILADSNRRKGCVLCRIEIY